MIEFVTEKNREEYESFVMSHPYGHFMQSCLWGRVKDNWIWEGVMSRGKDGAVRGAMSVLIRRLPVVPWTILYAGRAPVCDPHDRETLHELISGARQIARRYHGYELKMDPAVLSSDTAFAQLLREEGFRIRIAFASRIAFGEHGRPFRILVATGDDFEFVFISVDFICMHSPSGSSESPDADFDWSLSHS